MADGDHEAQTFLVDWPRKWASADDVRLAHATFEAASRRMAGRGEAVRCLLSVFVPTEERWICLFVADDWTAARTTADLAQIPERHLRSGVVLPLDTAP